MLNALTLYKIMAKLCTKKQERTLINYHTITPVLFLTEDYALIL